MKPIATLMKPLRSVDLTTLDESPAAIERSDVCAVPAAAVVGEAMVSLVVADAFLEKFGGDNRRTSRARSTQHRAAVARAVRCRARLSTRRRRDPDATARDAPAHPQATATRVLHRPAGAVDDLTPEIQQLIDDMIETMYAAPGIGLAAPQVGVPLRIFVVDLSAGPRAEDLLRLHQPGVRRARRHAARGGRLPERAGLQRHRAAPGQRRARAGLDRDGQRAGRSKARACWRARSSTRWITSTARCSSIGCAASSAQQIVRKIQKLRRAGKW